MADETKDYSLTVGIAAYTPLAEATVAASPTRTRSGRFVRVFNHGPGTVAIIRDETLPTAEVATLAGARASAKFRREILPGQEIELKGPVSAAGDFVFTPHYHAIADAADTRITVDPRD